MEVQTLFLINRMVIILAKDNLLRAVVRGERFQSEIKQALKRYPPAEYLPKAARLLGIVVKEINSMLKYPPHFLFQSMEVNCAAHYGAYQDSLDRNHIQKIINIYKNYYDPYSKYLIEEENNIPLFFLNQARQQFLLQRLFGVYDIARGLIIYSIDNPLVKSEKEFQEKFGFKFYDWFILCSTLFVEIEGKKGYPIINGTSLSNSRIRSVPKEAIPTFLDIISSTPKEVKTEYESIRQHISPHFETYITSPFTTKPLIRIDDKNYVVTHKPFILYSMSERLYQVCRDICPEEFGDELGKSFEKYIGRLLSEIDSIQGCWDENELKRFVDGSVCDHLVQTDDYILLIECKATTYSSRLATEIAVKQDNSTTKAAQGLGQLNATARDVSEGKFFPLIGNITDKPILGIVITYGELYFPNSQWYWEDVLKPKLKSSAINEISRLFKHRPQIMSVSNFENLILFSKELKESILKIFDTKLEQDFNKTGDWGAFLPHLVNSDIKEELQLLAATGTNFFDEIAPDKMDT